MTMLFVAIIFIMVVFPISNEVANGTRLFFNIAFPLDTSANKIALWMAVLFINGSLFVGVVCCSYTTVLWYIMLSLGFRYNVLGNQFKNLGKTELKVSIREQQTLYVKDFMAAIKAYDEINGYAGTSAGINLVNNFHFFFFFQNA